MSSLPWKVCLRKSKEVVTGQAEVKMGLQDIKGRNRCWCIGYRGKVHRSDKARGS